MDNPFNPQEHCKKMEDIADSLEKLMPIQQLLNDALPKKSPFEYTDEDFHQIKNYFLVVMNIGEYMEELGKNMKLSAIKGKRLIELNEFIKNGGLFDGTDE